MTTPDRLTRWGNAFEFATIVAAVQVCAFLLVAGFGGDQFATVFDETEIRCAFGGALLAFPFVLFAARYRCLGKK